MKQSTWYPFMFILVLGSLLLDACSFSVEVMNNNTNNYMDGLPTPTQELPVLPIDPTPAPTLTPVPVEALASATPTLITLREGLVNMLEIFATFQQGQGEVVRGLAFTPDETVLASAGGNASDFSIHLWDVTNYDQSLGTLDGHTGIVWDVAFSPNGQLLASVSSDQTLKVWDWRNKTVVYTQTFPGQVVSVSFSPDGQSLAVGGVDETINQIAYAAVWTYAVGSWQPLVKFPEYMNVAALAYSPRGGTLVGGGTSRNVQVWQAADGKPVYTLSHAHQVSEAVISPDGSTVATATCMTVVNAECSEGGVWIWNLPTGKLIQKIGGFSNTVERVAFTTDGSNLVVGSQDGTLRFFPTTNYMPLNEYQSPGGISALAVSPNGGLLATGNSNGEVHVWKNVYHP